MEAVALDIPLNTWRIGVLETGFGANDNPDAEPVGDVVRAAISRLEELGVATTRELESPISRNGSTERRCT